MAGQAYSLWETIFPQCGKRAPDLVGTRSQNGNQTGWLIRPDYYLTMFFPKLNFVPTVTRKLLRPPSSKFEKKL